MNERRAGCVERPDVQLRDFQPVAKRDRTLLWEVGERVRERGRERPDFVVKGERTCPRIMLHVVVEDRERFGGEKFDVRVENSGRVRNGLTRSTDVA